MGKERPKMRELRESLGLSQYDLADELGVCQQAISFWETGRNGISLKMAVDWLAWAGKAVRRYNRRKDRDGPRIPAKAIPKLEELI